MKILFAILTFVFGLITLVGILLLVGCWIVTIYPDPNNPDPHRFDGAGVGTLLIIFLLILLPTKITAMCRQGWINKKNSVKIIPPKQ